MFNFFSFLLLLTLHLFLYWQPFVDYSPNEETRSLLGEGRRVFENIHK